MRNRRKALVLGTAVGLVAGESAGQAGETVTYTHDSRGRLVRVARSGSVNNNVAANYSYDKADNRATVNVVSPNPP